MCETEIDDAIKQLQAGSVDAPEDLTLVALTAACPPEQRLRIASAIYAVLDEAHLLSSKTNKNLPVQQALCLASVATINVKLCLCSGASNTLQTLKLHWPKLRQWILYLKSDFVDQESVELSFRLLAKKCIGDFLGTCDDSFLGDLFDPIVTSPGIIATLVSLWRLETQDERFFVNEPAGPSSQPIFRISATLDSWMSAFSQREKWDWSAILHPFDDEPDALATTALDHLRQDIARIPVNYDLIVWDIHLLTTLSINEAIRISLLKQCSMTILTDVIKLLLDQYTITDRHSLVAKCLSYGYWYIRAYAESIEGLPWITEVVKAGLLPAILSTEPWIKHLNGQESEDWEPLFLLLDGIIPKYSVYGSALRHMSKELTTIDAGNLPGRLDKNGMLFESWSVFEAVVRKRAELYNSTAVGNETQLESCQNTECNKSGPPGSLKSCAACLHVNYCSKECQVYDWKNGGHPKHCREIQFRRKYCLSLPLSTLNVHFMDRLIAHDIRLLRDRIQDAATISDASPVIVELDYKEVPMKEEVGTIHTVPPINTCNCDPPLAEKWNEMVKLTLQAKLKHVLVRAFFPAGMSERVKLQCLPLPRALGDSALSTEDGPVSDLDKTYDLLCTGQLGGDIGAAFPSEVRPMRENLCSEVAKP